MQKIILILLYLSLSGCALFSKDRDDPARGWTVDRLYTEAKRARETGNYNRAVELYEFLETRFPFGVYGQQALLDLAYVYYKSGKQDQSISAADRFIRLYPQHSHVDYAYYLKGLANFNRHRSVTDRIFPTDFAERDVSSANAAFQNFSDLVWRFPDSIYSEDSRQRMIYLRNILAEHEIYVANYYMRRAAYVAAATRAKYVIENHDGTPSVPDALVIMAKAYKILGLEDLSNDALRVLELNHPGHPGIREVRQVVVR